jgi:hypothetical protein
MYQLVKAYRVGAKVKQPLIVSLGTESGKPIVIQKNISAT